MKKSKWLLIFCTLITFVLFLTGCSSSSDELTVNVSAADKHKILADLDVTGVLNPNQTINVESKVSGKVTSLNFEVGSKVKKGQVLIKLDTETLNSQLQQAQASLQSAQASLKAAQSQAEQTRISLSAAQTNYDRYKNLYDAGAVSKTDYENAKNNLDIMKKQYQTALQNVSGQSTASIEMAAASVNSIKTQIADAIIKSPIDGVITNKDINLGEVASPGVTLLTVSDMSILKLKGTIPQEALPFLTVGQQINMYIDIYSDKTFAGKIDNIGPAAINTGMYFPIEFSIKNSGDLKAGLSAHATISMASEAGLVVPVSALVEDNGEIYVFVVKDNIATKRTVVAGLKNDTEVEILKGLSVGETVATNNVNNIFDNMTVKVNTEKNNDKPSTDQ